MAIELQHSFAVPVPPEQAWDVLLDVARVAPCMPGATVETVDGDVVTGKIKVKVGPIALTYAGKATFTDKDAATHTVKMEASGKETRGAGTASATVQAKLAEDNGQTRVEVHTSLNVTGRPAQFGRGVMAEVGGRLIEKFSANLAQQLAAGETAAPAPAEAEAEAEAAAATAATPADARMGIRIEELNLPVRSFNGLKSEGIDTVGQLVARTGSDLLAIKNIGERSVEEIEEKLRDLGLALAERPPGGPARHATAASNGGPPPSGTVWDGDGGARAAAVGPATPDAGSLEDATVRGDGSVDDAIDLLDMAAGPILKRVLPAVGAAIVVIWFGSRLRRRRRAG